MNLSVRRITYLAGMLGVAIIVATTLAAALVFSGPDGSAYSVLNRKVSTLGKPAFSGWATLFNWGLKVGGLILAGFIVMLSIYIGRRAMIFVAAVGVVMAFGVVLVGICPVTQPQCHKIAAQIVFVAGFVTVASFTAILLWLKQDKLSIWLTVPGFIATLAFVLFLIILFVIYEDPRQVFIYSPTDENLPVLWWPSLLEWLVFLTVITWVFTLSAYLFWQEQAEKAVQQPKDLAHYIGYIAGYIGRVGRATEPDA